MGHEAIERECNPIDVAVVGVGDQDDAVLSRGLRVEERVLVEIKL